MTFDIQDALELAESASGEEVRITLVDDTEISCTLLGYDHQTDRINTGFGNLRRPRIKNVVVLERMNTIIENACKTGWVV